MAKSADTNVYESPKRHSSRRSAVIFLLIFLLQFGAFAIVMGPPNMFNTMMNTAYRLLMDTCFYLIAITVLVGAISGILSEFGVVDLLNTILSPLMRPLFGMPGAAALGVVTTYLSDNPAIVALASDNNYRKCFKQYQVPALTNIGTAFGMGLIVTTYIFGVNSVNGKGDPKQILMAVIIGNLGAVIGSIVSTRLMLRYTKKHLSSEPEDFVIEEEKKQEESGKGKPSAAIRFLEALLEGGKNGLTLGFSIVPGVVIICTFVMMLTNGPSPTGYTGAAYEGIPVLPFLGSKIDFILQPLFGFASASCVAVPITALGSAGAALGMIPDLFANGSASVNDLAVFNAMCMCWSGYLSTHISMMDALGYRAFCGRAIICHTIGGLVAGVSAHWLFVLGSLIFF